MESENPAVSSRPRPWLLVVLGLAVVLLLVNWMRSTSSATPAVQTSNQLRDGQRREPARIDPADLDIRLEALNGTRPAAGDVERNPFRFQPKAPPPAPPRASTPSLPPPTPPPPVKPPGPPPIPLKFIGIVEKQGLKVAAMSDCRSTFYGTEGQVIDGRYRLVRIGVESMVIEYVDGTGQMTVRLEGCPAR
jgi:hypothetical protein